jgi:hypothetical protein
MTQTSILTNLLQNPEIDDYDGAWFATIAYDVADFNQPVWVVIPDASPTHYWGPCGWQSRDAQTLPQKDDLGIVVFDNRRNLWLIAWWPFTDNTGETTLPPPKSKYPPKVDAVTGKVNSIGGIHVDQKTVTVHNGAGLGDGGGVPVTTTTKRGVIHDTEGAGDYQGQIDFIAANYPPHFAIGVDAGRPRITQFYPLGTSADATVAHDFEIWCQIEIIAPSGAAVGYTKGDWRTWLKPISDALQGLMGGVGVPMTYQGNPANRGVNWANAGWFGHNDVPDNDHADPGTGFPWSDYM